MFFSHFGLISNFSIDTDSIETSTKNTSIVYEIGSTNAIKTLQKSQSLK